MEKTTLQHLLSSQQSLAKKLNKLRDQSRSRRQDPILDRSLSEELRNIQSEFTFNQQKINSLTSNVRLVQKLSHDSGVIINHFQSLEACLRSKSLPALQTASISSLEKIEKVTIVQEHLNSQESSASDLALKLGHEKEYKTSEVRREPSVVSNDKFLESSVTTEDKILEPTVASNDKILESGVTTEDKIFKSSVASNDKILESSVVSNDKILESTVASNDKILESGVTTEDKIFKSSVASNDKILESSVVSDDKIFESTVVSNDKSLKSSDTTEDKILEPTFASNDKILESGVTTENKIFKSSVASNDKILESSVTTEDKILEPTVASNDKILESTVVSDDKILESSVVSNDKILESGVVSDDKILESTVVSDDKILESSVVSNDKILESGVVSDDKILESTVASDDKILESSVTTEDKILEPTVASDDKILESSVASDDKILESTVVSDDKILESSVASDDKILEPTVASNDKIFKSSVASDDKILESTVVSDDKILESSVASDDKILEPTVASNDKIFKSSVASNDKILEPSVVSDDKILESGVTTEDKILESSVTSDDKFFKVSVASDRNVFDDDDVFETAPTSTSSSNIFLSTSPSMEFLDQTAKGTDSQQREKAVRFSSDIEVLERSSIEECYSKHPDDNVRSLCNIDVLEKLSTEECFSDLPKATVKSLCNFKNEGVSATAVVTESAEKSSAEKPTEEVDTTNNITVSNSDSGQDFVKLYMGSSDHTEPTMDKQKLDTTTNLITKIELPSIVVTGSEKSENGENALTSQGVSNLITKIELPSIIVTGPEKSENGENALTSQGVDVVDKTENPSERTDPTVVEISSVLETTPLREHETVESETSTETIQHVGDNASDSSGDSLVVIVDSGSKLDIVGSVSRASTSLADIHGQSSATSSSLLSENVDVMSDYSSKETFNQTKINCLEKIITGFIDQQEKDEIYIASLLEELSCKVNIISECAKRETNLKRKYELDKHYLQQSSVSTERQLNEIILSTRYESDMKDREMFNARNKYQNLVEALVEKDKRYKQEV
ncbi:serine-rich adhesin for platelets-like [Clytia hemisphaerica]